MHIQYDRDEQDSMTCFTFDSTSEDQEQMRDLVDWLAGLGISTNKTTIRAPGGSKMICLLVNNIIRETIVPTKTVNVPTKTVNVPVKKEDSESESESDSESDSDEPVVPVTQKKPVVSTKSTTNKK